MRRFMHAPVSPDAPKLEIEAYDENAVLQTVGKVGFNEADVYEGGEYRFSLRLEAAVWCIYQRGEATSVAARQARA